jgi:hypothetical protein
MNSDQIRCALLNDKHTREVFVGVFASDTIPTKIRYPAGLIVNTDPQSLGGTHWVAIYVNEEGGATFFDSLGQPPHVEGHRQFLKRQCNSMIYYSKQLLQDVNSDVCGQYCVIYLAVRARGFSTKDFLNFFANSPSLLFNDRLINRLFVKYFGSYAIAGSGGQCCFRPSEATRNNISRARRKRSRNI